MTNTQPSFHMSPDEFRRWGYALIDWIAGYREHIEDFPVLSQVAPGEVQAKLPAHPPQQGESFEQMLRDVNEIIMPGVTHWQSPNFFAYFPSNASEPAILGELLSAGIGIQGMLWATSPACTELETHVMDWLAEMLDLPPAFRSTSTGGGVIQDSASSATLCALLAARERATAGSSNVAGVNGGATPRLVVYASTQAHSSIDKAVMIAGLGTENLRKIAVDDAFALRPDALATQIEADLAAGFTPAFVCVNVGSTSSNALDPIRAVGEICRRHNIWLHVDAAMSGTAALCPEFRFIHDGLELADSYTVNPHKWMFTNFDCNAFYVADRAALINALSILPEYLRNEATEAGAVIDYRDWQIPLGRRFRALKLWFVIRHYGVEGLQYHVRRHVALAQEFKQWVEESATFELMAPAPLNLVCFRHVAGDAVSEAIVQRLNASGALYLTHTKLNGAYTIRLVVGQTKTERSHVEAAWTRLREAAAAITTERT
jgi:aromatic-L-amino-acid decarboxylase